MSYLLGVLVILLGRFLVTQGELGVVIEKKWPERDETT